MHFILFIELDLKTTNNNICDILRPVFVFNKTNQADKVTMNCQINQTKPAQVQFCITKLISFYKKVSKQLHDSDIH